MAEPYRFGGPIPEQVKRLASRRAYRGSQLFATLKKNRRLDFLENPGPYWEQVRDGMGAVIDIRPKVVQAGAEAIVAAVSRARQAVAETVAPPRKIAPVAPELSATANKLTPLCAWRVDGPNFGRPGFTTDLEQAKFWVRRGATVTALHQPSEEGRFRTVSGAVLEKLTSSQPLDSWGCPLSESASTAGAVSQPPVTHCGSRPPSACPSGCRARSLDPDLSALEAFEEIAARARDFRLG